MTTILDHALQLASEGFWIFPVEPNGKKPAVKGWQDWATRDATKLTAWFTDRPDQNLGISTSRFGDDEALLVVDIDVKGGANGNDAIANLELGGFDFPATREHTTPSGGKHLVYKVPRAVRQGSNVLGPGVDIRSGGGLIVGPGSRTVKGSYLVGESDVQSAPAWLVERLDGSAPRRRGAAERRSVGGVSQPTPKSALSRAVAYLAAEAPLAVEGQAGDQTTYKVAARLKDIGCTEDQTFDLMAEHWNPRCSPPWDVMDLAIKVANAYAYGLEPPGVAAPENDFEPIAQPAEKLHPYDELNKNYAYVVAGDSDHILFETEDADGRPKLSHLDINTFHRKHAAIKLPIGKKTEPVTKLWMEWKERRSYDGLVFVPERPVSPRFYNLWRGFAVEALPASATPSLTAQAALDAFLEHALVNVCQSNAKLCDWLLNYFAHIVQRPWEKPLVALVFRGKKGTGKNALIDRIGFLLGAHYLLTSNRRYLVGNFNSHLENCLLFVLDEATWAGDKQGEGVLKDLITGSTHIIEPKGHAPYVVDNKTRVAIIGNENWLVPASHDERRYAVFEVGEGRRLDRDFFRTMREGMESGGYALLLRFLRARDLTGFDPNAAPATSGLINQKLASLEPFFQWWNECLDEGRIVGSEFGDDWPTDVRREAMRDAFARYCQKRRINGRQPADTQFGKDLKDCCPGVEGKLARGGNKYILPGLSECREAWTAYLGSG